MAGRVGRAGDGEIDAGGLARPGEGRRRRGAADELDGRRAGLDDEAGREAVGDGGWAQGAAAETGCGGETTRDAGRADGAIGRG